MHIDDKEGREALGTSTSACTGWHEMKTKVEVGVSLGILGHGSLAKYWVPQLWVNFLLVSSFFTVHPILVDVDQFTWPGAIRLVGIPAV